MLRLLRESAWWGRGRLVVLVALVALAAGAAPSRVAASPGLRCFQETGLCIKGRIRQFWERNGGLPVFGLPITPQRREHIGGQAVVVQWFERNRIELHPENSPPYDVLLGRIGSEWLEQRAPNLAGAASTPQPAEQEPCRLFEETGYRVCGDILAAWRASGLELDGQTGTSEAESLALFGLPLSNARAEVLDNGEVYVVQWFERARFELHPEHTPPHHVQLGLLGRAVWGDDSATWPRFETSTCPFRVPGGLAVTCGYLTVPEDRSQPDSRNIQLAVAIVSARGPAPRPDPLVYLSGGPGSSALVNATRFATGWSWLLTNRDFVVFDQRGTGFSRPALDCPELGHLASDLLGREVTRAEKVRAEVDTALSCRNRLVSEGVNVAGYTSAASAADLEDLRVALGYEQWNLFGISYGTRLALTTMRDYPGGIRSVVLDSVYPVQANLFTEMPANLKRSLQTLFDHCAANPACNQSYPNLEQVFYEVVDQLNAQPVTVWPRSPSTGQAIKVRVDGTELISLMFRLFYDTRSLALLPQMIYDIHRGSHDLLTSLEQRRLGRSSGRFSHGTYFSVECGEEIVFATREEVDATRTAYPRLQPFFEGIPENTPEIFRLCEGWGMRYPPSIENAPVVSDIPTLILAGEYDPITPPAWGRLAAETLSRSYVYEFPNTGHAVIGRGACPQQIIRSFLDGPAQPPDTSCVP